MKTIGDQIREQYSNKEDDIRDNLNNYGYYGFAIIDMYVSISKVDNEYIIELMRNGNYVYKSVKKDADFDNILFRFILDNKYKMVEESRLKLVERYKKSKKEV